MGTTHLLDSTILDSGFLEILVTVFFPFDALRNNQVYT